MVSNISTVNKKGIRMGLFLPLLDCIVTFENVLLLVNVPFSLVQNGWFVVYLSAAVATRRANKIITNMCLSS